MSRLAIQTLQQQTLSRGTQDVAALIGACAQGDRAALDRLYRQQAPRLYAIALRICRDAPLASDVLHDTFLRIWRGAAQFDPSRGQAEAWLTGITRNRALDMVRGTHREVTGLELPDTIDESQDVLGALIDDADATALRRCLGELDEPRRRLVVMAFMDGLTHAELSTRLRMPLGTVKSSIRRGLLSLKRCLES